MRKRSHSGRGEIMDGQGLLGEGLQETDLSLQMGRLAMGQRKEERGGSGVG